VPTSGVERRIAVYGAVDHAPWWVLDAEPISEVLLGWGFSLVGEVTPTDATYGGMATRVVWNDAPR
jgi:hypothetical protein